MSDHLSPEAIDRFAARAMDREERVATQSHLLACPECRARLRASAAYPEVARREAAVIGTLAERPSCPEPKLRTAFASGASSGLTPEQRAEIATHLRHCRSCARDVRVLESVRIEANRPTTNVRRLTRPNRDARFVVCRLIERWFRRG